MSDSNRLVVDTDPGVRSHSAENFDGVEPCVIAVRIVPAAAAHDAVLVDEIAALINDVYAVAEEGLWVDGTPRTTSAEVAELIAAGQIAVARAKDRIVGAVRIQRLETGEGEFGMLAADPAHRGMGIGRELVRFAEHRSREQGLDTMQLEILVPPVGNVTPRGEVSAAELLDHVAGRVAPYKRLAEVRFVAQIPRSPAGKILRRMLAENAG